MCRVLRYALLGALLVVPLAAAEPAATSPAANPAINPLTSSPLFGALSKSQVCTQSVPPVCCEPDYSDCEKVFTGVSFVRQKPNNVCVYQCPYNDVCSDTTGCTTGHTTTLKGLRVRSQIGDYPPGGCPAADISFCTTMEIDP